MDTTLAERKRRGLMKLFTRPVVLIVLVMAFAVQLGAQTTHDPGYPEERTWLDVNGDHVPDYCRVVGNPGHYQIACAVSSASGYKSLYSPPASPIDRGYPSSGGFFSPAAGVVMYCSGVGNSPSPFILSCSRYFVPNVIAAAAAGGNAQPLSPP
jgi:hypothetical protein